MSMWYQLDATVFVHQFSLPCLGMEMGSEGISPGKPRVQRMQTGYQKVMRYLMTGIQNGI